MKKLLFLAALFGAGMLSAQTRYLNPVFSEVEVTSNVVYGQNATVLLFPTIVKQPLVMDVYRPKGDTETSRPVVIYFHTGNFLPFQGPDGTLGFNGSCGGTKTDSSAIEICTRLAKMGYVAISATYRAGWNPLAPSDVDRRFGIINAAYRGIQDLRTAVRFLRRNVAEAGNTFGINPDKIVVWGQGTGGYLTLNALTLDNYLKIPFASNGKFLYDHDNNPNTPPIPMVVEQINGNIFGTSVGILPTTGDTLCYPNHVGYSSDFNLAVNLGGACADSSWVDPGQKPLISFHVPYDNFAPYAQGIVTVPGTNLQVVEVQGSYLVQKLQDQFGNNASFSTQYIPDLGGNRDAAYAQTPKLQGNDWSAKFSGLYPLVQPIVSQNPIILPATTAPWEWSGPVPNNPTCSQNKASALVYIDTIMRFYAPRACFALGLQNCIDAIVSQKEPIADIALTMAPNPAVDRAILTAPEGQLIRRIEVFNNMGAQVRLERNVNAQTFELRRDALPAGAYYVKVSFDAGFVTRQLQFN
ncbi:MAG: T9SS type A sorting domain-containing protein [Saprospiraceae bacterium]